MTAASGGTNAPTRRNYDPLLLGRLVGGGTGLAFYEAVYRGAHTVADGIEVCHEEPLMLFTDARKHLDGIVTVCRAARSFVVCHGDIVPAATGKRTNRIFDRQKLSEYNVRAYAVTGTDKIVGFPANKTIQLATGPLWPVTA